MLIAEGLCTRRDCNRYLKRFKELDADGSGKLDSEDINWRSNTVILLDGAPYHTSESTLELMEGLRIPTLFTGPHSYDAVPAELLFAAFKADDINPSKVPQGKR